MNQTRLQPKKIRSSTAFFISATLFGWLVLILAVTGAFFTPIIVASLIAIGVTNFILWRKGMIIAPPKKSVMLLAPFVFIAIVISLTATPTIFSGRDQGSLSEASIRLSDNHQFPFETNSSKQFFQIYGPGKALNFPGFYYTPSGELSTQFPLGYIAWSGAFYSLFGLLGFLIGNAVFFGLFLIAFLRLIQELASRKTALLSLIFIFSSFSFVWFFKFTLSEVMALALLWIGIAELVSFIRSLNPHSLVSLFLAFGLLALTRIEGLVFLAIVPTVLLLLPSTRLYIRKHQDWCIFLPVAIFVTVFLLASKHMMPFIWEMGRVLSVLLSSTAKASASTSASPLLISILSYYGLLAFLLFGFVGVIILFSRKKWLHLIPIMVITPTLIYLIEPHISNDHPWMLRRFMFSILPAGILYTSLLINQIVNSERSVILRRASIAAIIFVSIAFCLPSTTRYAFKTENPTLWNQARELGQKFSNQDLVLIDRSVTNDGWNMITGPLSSLENLETVYFFNPEDLNKLNLNSFSQVYLLVAEAEAARYTDSVMSSRLSITDKFSINTSHLRIVSNESRFVFPVYQQTTTDNIIFSVTK